MLWEHYGFYDSKVNHNGAGLLTSIISLIMYVQTRCFFMSCYVQLAALQRKSRDFHKGE